MTKIEAPPKKKKRFNVKVIKVVCGDCNVVMKRWNDPYEPLKEHFENKCPICGMHIRAFEGSYHCIDVNGRPYLEIKWNMSLEEKAKIIETEAKYWKNVKAQRKEMDDLQKVFDEETKKDMLEAQAKENKNDN